MTAPNDTGVLGRDPKGSRARGSTGSPPTPRTRKLRRAVHRRDESSLDQVLPNLDDGHHHGDPSGDRLAKIDDPAIQSELRDVLASAIDEPPANHRAVFVLHDVEALSMAEVAAALGISLATAKTTAHRARLRLRKRLGRFLSPTMSAVDVPA